MPNSFGEMTCLELFYELQVLNPSALIKWNYDMFIAQSDVAIDELVLPKGFYCDGNRITNKGNTRSGISVSITLEPLNLKELNQTKNSRTPKMRIIDKIKQKIFPQNDREM